MAYADEHEIDPEEARMGEEAEPREPTDLMRDMGEVEGDVSDLLDDDERMRVAGRAVDEFRLDKSDRREWDATIERALAASKQTGEAKNSPWPNASNLKYPALTNAALQFGSRTMGALMRDESVVKPKVFGSDPQGLKAAKGQRTSEFANYQLMYQCDEWQPGTDRLCHALPVLGTMFRKLYWSKARNRPVIDTVSARDVYVTMDAPSLMQAPRVTHGLTYYPYEIAQRVAAKVWRKHEYTKDGADTQKPCRYIEQYRYEDLDRDGLPEPYVVTVHEETMQIVRLEPAFDPTNVRAWESGAGDALVRDLPWIDYGFLPNPEGGFYSIGFGHLLEPLQSAINTLLNQIIDAGTRANAGGGLITQGLKLRASTIRIRPGVFEPVNVAGDIREAIHEFQFSGANQTQMTMLELLLGAAKDLTGNADVLTGDMPNEQHVAQGTVLALIEQGLQVFSTIYKRLYWGERRAHRRLFGLNRDFLSKEAYQGFLDQPADPQEDFDMRGVDVLPVSDPAGVTDMQRLARANFLGARAQAAPLEYNSSAVEMRILAAARIENVQEILAPPDSPMRALSARKADADVAKTESESRKAEAGAEKEHVNAQQDALEHGRRAGELKAVADGTGRTDVPQGAQGDGDTPG